MIKSVGNTYTKINTSALGELLSRLIHTYIIITRFIEVKKHKSGKDGRLQRTCSERVGNFIKIVRPLRQ